MIGAYLYYILIIKIQLLRKHLLSVLSELPWILLKDYTWTNKYS